MGASVACAIVAAVLCHWHSNSNSNEQHAHPSTCVCVCVSVSDAVSQSDIYYLGNRDTLAMDCPSSFLLSARAWLNA